ncbi:MAG: NADH-quinone oxidoreductase subunit NuoE [Acidobacteriota bacterium]|jgi:NADH-quinone oxidoreductase subunit E|nr:NADH-quinone oxidoreductase subunit NuoE [Acidobacteriota bacterium]
MENQLQPELDERQREEFRRILRDKAHRPGVLIVLLQQAQELFGYIPEPIIFEISAATGVPAADIYGVITFYSQFRLLPMGRNVIRICEGTACHVNGAKGILQAIEEELHVGVGETTRDGEFTLLSVACLGCCSLSPVIMINNETFGRLTPQKVRDILKKHRQQSA